MDTNTYGVLSGIEIAEAVGRKKRFDRIAAEPAFCSEEDQKWYDANKDLPRIHIDDFDPRPSDLGGPLNPNSYNLRLAPELLIYDPGTLDMKEQNSTCRRTIPPDGFVMYPGEIYLGQTVERTESFNVRPCLNGRSSIGRLGLGVHVCAGYGDAGFCGSWTLELTVVRKLRVYAGIGICQIDYTTISPNHRPYQSRKYQNQKEVRASRLWMDFERQEEVKRQEAEHPQG